jgi:hypothetical protein
VHGDDQLDVLQLANQLGQLSADNVVGHSIKTERYIDVTIYGTPANVGEVDPKQVRHDVRALFGPHKSEPRKHHARHQRPVDSGCIN